MKNPVRLPQLAAATDTALALVCTLPTGEREGRRASVQSAIHHALTVREIPNGVSLLFDGSADTARSVTDVVLAERQCCAQFTYTLTFAPNAGIELRVEAVGDLIGPLQRLYLGPWMESENA